MKIRKMLPLALLALCAVFLLSSCDAMLDAIFSNNTITVYVSTNMFPYGAYYSSDSVTVTVSGPTFATATARHTGYSGWYDYWEVSVPKLSDGTYTVTVAGSFWNGSFWTSPLSNPTQYVITMPNAGSHSETLSFDF